MTGLDDDILQRLYDEELDASEAEKAREAIAENPADAKRLESLAQMRVLIRAEAEAAADAADFKGLWPAVASRIHSEGSAEATAEDPGTLARFKAWLGQSMGGHPVAWAAAGVCAMVVAVVVAVLISSSPKPAEPPPPSSIAGPPASDDLDIEKLEFKGRHPDIFKIKDGKLKTTVIWVYPEEEDDDNNGADPQDDPGSSDPI